MGTQGRRETLADTSYCTIYVTRHPRSLKLWVAILLLKIDLKSFYTMFSPFKAWGDVAFMGAMFNICKLGEATLEMNR